MRVFLAQRIILKGDHLTQDVGSPEFADEVLASVRNFTYLGGTGWDCGSTETRYYWGHSGTPSSWGEGFHGHW